METVYNIIITAWQIIKSNYDISSKPYDIEKWEELINKASALAYMGADKKQRRFAQRLSLALLELLDMEIAE